MDTNRIPKQALQGKPKGGETMGDVGNDGRINFTLRFKEKH